MLNHHWPPKLALFVGLLLWSLSGIARPGKGNIRVGASGAIRPGGFIIDIKQALTKANGQALDVSWDSRQDLVVVTAGKTTHTIEVKKWEMHDLVSIALRPTVESRFEVSLDVVGEKRNFYASPALMEGAVPSGVGNWLQQADLQYADVVQGPGDIDEFLGEGISPRKAAIELLRNDPAYRKLARDLVQPPSDWPNLELMVVDLTSPSPLKWITDFQVQFMMPDGMQTTPEAKNGDEAWMIREAFRPYRRLKEGITGRDSRLRNKLTEIYPTIEAAKRYSILMAAFRAFCERNTATCRKWLDQAGPFHGTAPEPKRYSQASVEAYETASRTLRDEWKDARLELALAETNRDYRRWIFVDEVMWSLTAGRRYTNEQLLALLPANDKYGRGEVKHAVQLYESAVLTWASAESGTSLDDPVASFLSVVNQISGNEVTDHFWRDRAGVAALELARLDSVKRTGGAAREALIRAAGNALTECSDELAANSAEALRRPTGRSEWAWRVVLARTDRCLLGAIRGEPSASLIRGSIHYAIGISAANAGRKEDGRNRARLLRSMADVSSASDAEAGRMLASLAENLARQSQ